VDRVELDAEEVVLARSLTIPNAISLLRLVVMAVALVVLFDDRARVAAAALLAIAGATDFLDGYVARRIGQVSRLGKILDPTIDRMVLAGSIIAILVYGALPWWIAVIVLTREVFISVVAIVVAAAGATRIDVLWIGKASTFGLLVAFPLFLVSDGPGGFAHALRVAAYVVVVPALAASIASVVAYVPVARRALVTGRQATGMVDRARA
jgi:cardiolipin synthase (CMP-forming)